MDDDNQIEREGHGETLRQRHLLEIVECEDANGNTPVSEAASMYDLNLNDPSLSSIVFIMELF